MFDWLIPVRRMDSGTPDSTSWSAVSLPRSTARPECGVRLTGGRRSVALHVTSWGGQRERGPFEMFSVASSTASPTRRPRSATLLLDGEEHRCASRWMAARCQTWPAAGNRVRGHDTHSGHPSRRRNLSVRHDGARDDAGGGCPAGGERACRLVLPCLVGADDSSTNHGAHAGSPRADVCRGFRGWAQLAVAGGAGSSCRRRTSVPRPQTKRLFRLAPAIALYPRLAAGRRAGSRAGVAGLVTIPAGAVLRYPRAR